MKEKINKVKEKCEEELKQYSEIENILSTKLQNVDKKSTILYLSTVNYGVKMEEAQIKWCEETLKKLEEV
jgi:hypothetical protein